MRQILFERFSSEGYSAIIDNTSSVFINKMDSEDPNK